MRRLAIVLVGVLLLAAGYAAASGLSAPPGKTTTNTNAGNDRRGDTDTTAECPPGQGGDPCVANGNSAPGTDKGHGNCDDNRGKGSNGNDNGNGRSCATTTVTTETQPTTTAATTTAATTTQPSRTTTLTTTAASTPGTTTTGGAASPPGATTPTPPSPPSATPPVPAKPKLTVKRPAAPPTRVRQLVTPGPQPTGSLPFTGSPLWIPALLGVLSILSGVGLWRSRA